MNQYMPNNTKITDVIKMTEDTFLFRVRAPLNNDPGQFVQIGKFGFGECPISICSYDKDYIDLCIRNVGNVTKKLLSLRKGDLIGIRGPYGKGYPMAEMHKKDLLIIAGGTGVAPVRGAIEYYDKNIDKFGSLDILLGFRNPDEILFEHDIDEWKKRFNLDLTVDKGARGWKGKTGLITNLITDKIKSENKAAIICGPPIMMKFVIQNLQKLEFKDQQIYISYERHMKCGIGKCGRCMKQGKYVCRDGPVFRYDEVRDIKE